VRDFREMSEPELSQKLAELRTQYPNLAIDALISKDAAFDVSFPNPSLVYNRALPRVSLNPVVIPNKRSKPKITIQGTDPFGNPSGILHEMEVVKK
jgi:hypothetical protein